VVEEDILWSRWNLFFVLVWISATSHAHISVDKNLWSEGNKGEEGRLICNLKFTKKTIKKETHLKKSWISFFLKPSIKSV